MKFSQSLKVPEIFIIFLAFFLNFFWEVVHTNFFTFKAMPYNTLLNGWFHCVLGDILITIVAFWLISLINRSRKWFLSMNIYNFVGFVAIGFVYTFYSEHKHLFHYKDWAYNESMPLVPFTGIGLTPILQWLFIPPIIILFVRHYFLLTEKADIF